ncbi:hypothetical protein [Bacteroides xylanisolvens]|uniref:hypothetical protein n=1 Tax=Bacteroides xylanisolvens TaxID=371601 RepID=UPI00325B75B9
MARKKKISNPMSLAELCSLRDSLYRYYKKHSCVLPSSERKALISVISSVMCSIDDLKNV